MAEAPNIDGVLVTWGDRLFYPGNRIVGSKREPKLDGRTTAQRAAEIRRRIHATVVRRAPQVMVKVTGGGRSMRAIAAHLRYISKNGRLEIEDQRGETLRGKDCLRALAEEWRLGGSLIPEDADSAHRREALNIMLSMPRATDPMAVLRSAREFARTELDGHKYAMVLHDHQANPHVHISVRAEAIDGRRLNLRKADLQRWRETFADKLRGWGIEAEATRQAARGQSKNYEPLWCIKAHEGGRLRTPLPRIKADRRSLSTLPGALDAWRHISQVLRESPDSYDRALSRSINGMLADVLRTAAPTKIPDAGRNSVREDTGRSR